MNWEETFKSVEAWLTTAGIKVLIALILFVVAFKLIDFFSKKIEKKAEKKIEENKNIDKTVYRALSYITKIGPEILTAIVQPIEEMAQKLVSMIISQIEGKKIEEVESIFGVTVQSGETC